MQPMALGNRRGFTMIELLVVIAIIGLLASIAIPKYVLLKDRARIAAIKSDLKNLVAAQEAFFAIQDDYAGGIAPTDILGVGGAGRAGFVPSPDVVMTVTYHSSPSVGWSATATDPGIASTAGTDTCGIFMGSPTFAPNAAVVSPGVSACW